MIQIRIHGRGGQGVVSASEMLAVAAFYQGLYAQSFPSFGSERMGAPVQAYVRLDDHAIELREPVLDPDVLIIQDTTLFQAIEVFNGLRPDGYVLINSRKTVEELGVEEAVSELPPGHVVTVPATDLALKHLRRPTPNTVLVGAFAAMHDALDLSGVERAIREQWPGKIGEINVVAARAAYELVTSRLQGQLQKETADA